MPINNSNKDPVESRSQAYAVSDEDTSQKQEKALKAIFGPRPKSNAIANEDTLNSIFEPRPRVNDTNISRRSKPIFTRHRIIWSLMILICIASIVTVLYFIISGSKDLDSQRNKLEKTIVEATEARNKIKTDTTTFHNSITNDLNTAQSMRDKINADLILANKASQNMKIGRDLLNETLTKIANIALYLNKALIPVTIEEKKTT